MQQIKKTSQKSIATELNWVGSEMKLIKKQNCSEKLKLEDKIKNAADKNGRPEKTTGRCKHKRRT